MHRLSALFLSCLAVVVGGCVELFPADPIVGTWEVTFTWYDDDGDDLPVSWRGPDADGVWVTYEEHATLHLEAEGAALLEHVHVRTEGGEVDDRSATYPGRWSEPSGGEYPLSLDHHDADYANLGCDIDGSSDFMVCSAQGWAGYELRRLEE